MNIKKAGRILLFVDSPVFLITAAIITALLVMLFFFFPKALSLSFLDRKPAIVLINESSLFLTMEHHIPQSDLGSPSRMREDAAYLSHFIDNVVHYYHQEGIAVCMAKGAISFPKQDDITPLLRQEIIRHFEGHHAKG